MNKAKEISLYRYVCDECGIEFKVDYEDGLINISHCPFCGIKRDDELEHIIYDGEFRGKIKYYEPGEEDLGEVTNVLELLPKAYNDRIINIIKKEMEKIKKTNVEERLNQRDKIIYNVLTSEFEDYENVFDDEAKESMEQYLIDKLEKE